VRRALSVLALALVVSATAAARADAPGPRSVCGVKGLPCTACPQATDAGYEACAAAARAGGLVSSCQDYQHEGDGFATEYFCPPGTEVRPANDWPRAGCNRCSAGGDTSRGGLALFAAAAASVAALRRRVRGRDGAGRTGARG
jgi:MYXO-CTERM domain-containing protein